MKYSIAKAIQNGLAYIKSTQNQDGSFTSYLGTEKNDIKKDEPHRTTFISSLILASLSSVQEARSSQVLTLLAHFVNSQKDANWTYNYWTKDEPNREKTPYPNDLDDTFCAYNALLKVDQANITPEVLAEIVKVLIATEVKAGGPYKTWLVPDGSDARWLDIDPAVNSNIAFFLSQIATIPSGLHDYLRDSIRDQKLISPYYPSVLPTVYYLSRCPIENITDCLELLPKEERELSALDIALTANILLRLNEYERGQYFIEKLLHTQQSDGSWLAGGFSIDRIVQSKPYYSGSAALTTAFALEALAQYKDYYSRQMSSLPSNLHTKDQDVGQQIFDYADSLCNPLPSLIHAQLKKRLSTMRKSGNGNEILENAIMLNSALKKPISNNDQLFLTLGSANLYGWVAYTIYDDFIDEEGDPTLLSIANAAHRISYNSFLRSSPNTDFRRYVEQTFNIIDDANNWEALNCRSKTTDRLITISHLPDYGDLSMLAHRSIGHILPPLTILTHSGVAVASEDFVFLEQSFKHYLIAKQLNDDAHDWQDDFNNGHMSFVVSLILQELCVVDGTYDKRRLSESMQRHFWYHTILNVCEEIERNVTLSKRALRKMRCLKAQNDMYATLEKIKESVVLTRKQQKETVAFLRHYQHK